MAESDAPYEVLARRYRSRDFAELVGQEAIAETLQNAIESKRTAHAYLFCGTRGVGKTSMARIFARALNATGGLLGEEREVADAILQGRDSDVIEIDAASNRGIDNARELIANSGIAPMRSPYRIYIIDEVHMLTSQAFNALLKTMEEPPKHVKFILCTTEPHQVPATIQSRCQRFDFRAIPSSRIAAHLAEVLEKEGIASEPEVLARIARMANGSMRDALSLLDRLASGARGRLTSRQLEDLFGLPEDAVIDELLGGVSQADVAGTLRAAGQLLDRGLSPERLLDSLAERMRELLVVATCGEDSELLETAAERRPALAALAAYFDPAMLASMIALCDSVGRSIRSSSAPRALLDAALARLAMSGRFAEAAGLLAGQPAGGDASTKKPRAPVAGAEPPRPVTREPVARRQSARIEAKVEAATPAVPPPESPVPSSSTPTAVDPDDRLAALTTPARLTTFWEQAIEQAGTPRRRAMLESVKPVSYEAGVLRMQASGPASAAKWLETRPEPLLEFLREFCGRKVAVRFDPLVLEEAPRPSGDRVAPEVLANPLVREAMDLFDASVLRTAPAASWSESGGVGSSHEGISESIEDDGTVSEQG
jgi:DNA polymerase-3 subunit gamma/tau